MRAGERGGSRHESERLNTSREAMRTRANVKYETKSGEAEKKAFYRARRATAPAAAPTTAPAPSLIVPAAPVEPAVLAGDDAFDVLDAGVC